MISKLQLPLRTSFCILIMTLTACTSPEIRAGEHPETAGLQLTLEGFWENNRDVDNTGRKSFFCFSKGSFLKIGQVLKFSRELLQKPRWLVINKIDLLSDPDRHAAQQALVEELCWEGPVFQVSAETGQGTDVLGQAVMRWFEEQYAEVATETL